MQHYKWRTVGILLISLTVQSSFAEQTISAQPFINVKASSQEIHSICQQLSQKCSDEVKLWKPKNTQDQTYYLIDETPQIAQVKKQNNQYTVINQWNFKNYEHTNKEPHSDDLGPDGLKIFPALYPLNKNEYAIAVLNTWFTGYSGGGVLKKMLILLSLSLKGGIKLH